MYINAFKLAERLIGVEEIKGSLNNPQIMAMLKLTTDDNKVDFNNWPDADEVAWCSAFVNYICWWLRLPRSKDLRARSWLKIGTVISKLSDANIGFDIVVLKRGSGKQPGPEVIDAQGHVGFFAGYEEDKKIVYVLGGNQSDEVNVSRFKESDVLGIRRLYTYE